MFVKPKLGALVRDPQTMRPLPEEGAVVAETPFWLRRLACGDVALASRPILRVVQIPDTQSLQIPDTGDAQ